MNNEQVRAAALEVEYPMPAAQNNALERFKAVDNRAAFLKGWDRALATTAAPERSGKLADEVVGVIVADDPVYGWHIRALKPWDQIGAGTKLYTRAPEADSSSAAPSEICECDGDSHKEECPVMVARNWPDLDRVAAPAPTGESLSEKPCVGCNGAGVIGTPGMPCPFCPVEKKLREFEAALATPRQTSDPAAEDERLSKRIGATKGALASALRRPCVVKLEPGSSPSPFDPVFTTVTLDAEIPPPHQTEDGSRLSAAIDRGADGDWLWSRFMTLCKKHGVNEGGPLGNDLFGIVSDLRGLAPKETAVQGGVPEAEPVAWIRKTDITELTDSEPETNGWTPLYAAPTGAPSEAGNGLIK